MLVLDETVVRWYVDDKIKHCDRMAERAIFGKVTDVPTYELDIASQEDTVVVPDVSLPSLQAMVISARISADIRREKVISLRYPDYQAAAMREAAVTGGQWEAIASSLTGMGLTK